MIQVLDRAFHMIELMRQRGAMALGHIADELGVQPNTAWNITDSLVDLGVLRKTRNGWYDLEPLYFNLGGSALSLFESIGREAIEALAKDIDETMLLCVKRRDTARVIAERACQQATVINRGRFPTGPLYGWAAGHVMLAYASFEELTRYKARHGLPGKQWPTVNRSSQRLNAELKTIRSQGHAVKDGDEVISLAVPIVARGDCYGTLAIAIPRDRHTKTGQRRLLATLKSGARQMEQGLELAQRFRSG